CAAAAALKCMGGEIQGLLAPRDEAERQAAIDLGYDLSAVLTTDDLVRGNNCFFAATGITDGELLRGVRYERNGARTQSLVMRSKSGTVRMIDARHRIDKLSAFAAVDYACPRSAALHHGGNASGEPSRRDARLCHHRLVERARLR